jgi:D-2-hydroxyacid dehydrogenase (NADP+)
MTDLLILLTFPEEVRNQYRDRIKAAFPALRVNVVDHHDKVGPYIADAEILVTFGPMMADHVLHDAKKLRWIQALGTGVDGIADRPSLKPGTIVTNVHGIHGAPVSEAALSAMLALSRGLPELVRNQDKRQWRRWPARLLHRKTVGILGIGAIAEDLAPRCQALGMRVVGITGTPRHLQGFDRMVSRDAMLAVMPELDYLVLLVPYASDTKGLVGEAVFAAMKPDAYLVNLARGGVVDEPALIRALEGGRIAGAALDVFSEEPLPAEHPLWSAPNLLISPHQGGFCDVYVDHAMPVITENIRHFLAGDMGAMRNQVEIAQAKA